MYLFDLHCDTVTRLNTGEHLAPGDNLLRSNGAHIALDRMAGLCWCQCFAIFIPDSYRGQAAVDFFEDTYRYFGAQLAENADRIAQARTPADIRRIIGEGRCAALLTVEGGAAMAGDLARAGWLAGCGVRVLTLTWNGPNEIGSGNETAGGITPFGAEAVRALEAADVVVDVSHLNDRGFWEVAELANRPFIATHSNSRAICGHPRNLTDDQFREIVSVGGLVGLNFCIHFLADGGDPTFDQLAAHLAHFLALGGQDTLALGSDYDGTDVPSWLDPAEKVRCLYPLVSARFGDCFAQKLFFENAMRFFERYDQTKG